MSNDETTSKESNSMSASLACLGTTTVSLHTSSKKKQEGLLAVFHDNDTLRLSLATNTDDDNKSVLVYHGCIAMKDVKMKLEYPQKPDKQAKAFATHLLHATSSNSNSNNGQSVTPSYSLSSDDDSDNIKLVIKYQHRVITQTKKKMTSHNKSSDDDDDDEDAMSEEEEEVAMKKAWSGILSRDTSPTAPLHFYKSLGQSINRGQTTLTASQSQMEQLQRDRNSWKHTAQQLQGKWQHEKDQLLRNFCTLYNPTRQALATCQEENKQLQAQAAEQESTTNNRKTKKKTKTTAQPDTEELQAPLPDVGDVYDDALAKAYATGKRVDIRNNHNQKVKMEPTFNNKTKKSSIDCSASDSDDTVVDIPPAKTTTTNKKVVRTKTKTKTNTTASNKQKKNAKHSANRYDDSSDDDRKPTKIAGKPKRTWDDSDASDSTGNKGRANEKRNKKRKSPFSDDSNDST
ncbi:expressed unknown protein [Seminavis robusta]|uniref:Uncharacterized protein n=1 Tax=Seminavis robusta TaxID=568900 RepID=A0A9N8E7I1_9STRA|nr:expressed unknown protein [Seminavis robusta]|eukprot:Sro766_g199320.1 n/a (459) ;mRNA; f:17289-18665